MTETRVQEEPKRGGDLTKERRVRCRREDEMLSVIGFSRFNLLIPSLSKAFPLSANSLWLFQNIAPLLSVTCQANFTRLISPELSERPSGAFY